MKRLIVSADDFGISPEVNEAIERAHRTGILRAASLMVGAPATADAVERARRLPDLAVGLHVVLVRGRPTLPPDRVPDLVDARGEFPTDLVSAGFRYFFRPGVRRQLEAEIREQFERFAASGLQLDHVDAQCHMHVHPTVFGLILRVGREYGLRAIRIPREPFALSYRAAGDRFGARLGNTLLTEPWLALMRMRARRSGVACNDYAFGVNDPGAMTEGRVLRLLGGLPDGVTELFFHPATGPFAGADAGTECFAWAEELAALTSANVRNAMERYRIANVTYGEIAGGAAAG
ncbi:MAG: hopanoid biosynthesis-associated protein HpnK [Candidatus Tumulicola sp.]